MADVIIKDIKEFGFIEETQTIPTLDSADYEERIARLREHMARQSVDFAVVYGDREYFSNMYHLCGYDPRFEQALFVVPKTGNPTIIVGNEGYDYTFASPLEMQRVLYQNFSLQGQPRTKLVSLGDILADCGITNGCSVGVIGVKYFNDGEIENPRAQIDIPAYILDIITGLCGRENAFNFTAAMTDTQTGVRMRFSAKQIAVFEYAANASSNRVVRMQRALEPGVTELGLSALAGIDGNPLSVHPNINFGGHHIEIGLRSPDYTKLHIGDPVTISNAVRGSLVCRSGIAMRNEADETGALAGIVDNFYKPYFKAITTWLENLKIGAVAGEVYREVMDIIGGEEFGVALNPGHNIGEDEWTNSPFAPNSTLELLSGQYYQCDMIIGKRGDVVAGGILEDGYVLADAALRAELEREFPETYSRMQRRRKFMTEQLGIALAEEVLPMSNCAGIFCPYMLDSTRCFALEK